MESISDKVIYPKLSYEILGAAFDVFNTLGYGMNEKYYQRALALEFTNRSISFTTEQPIHITYKQHTLGKCYLDFLVENKIVIELKVRPKLGYIDIKQVMDYLRTTQCKLQL